MHSDSSSCGYATSAGGILLLSMCYLTRCESDDASQGGLRSPSSESLSSIDEKTIWRIQDLQHTYTSSLYLQVFFYNHIYTAEKEQL